MSSKAELQHKLNEIGYKLAPFASKETLTNVIRLHSLVSKISFPFCFESFSLDCER